MEGLMGGLMVIWWFLSSGATAIETKWTVGLASWVYVNGVGSWSGFPERLMGGLMEGLMGVSWRCGGLYHRVPLR